MTRQLHSATAAAAITLVLCVACVAFMVFVLLPAAAAIPTHRLAIAPVSTHILHIARAAVLVLMFGYLAGLVGWTTTFALHRDGMHRLASVLKAR